MENLASDLGIKVPTQSNSQKSKLTPQDIQNEYKTMESLREFMVYEKNIEHLSHMLDTKSNGPGKRFYPSTSKPGSITGNEFPAKVWSLTYDDGPGKLTSPKIIKSLRQRNLKATFFQLTKQVKALPSIAKEIKDAGMEMALSLLYSPPAD